MKTVLFACVHNAGRSQMAAAFFNQTADRSQIRAVSAGTRPADRVDPAVVEAMRETGIDLNSVRPRLLTEADARSACLLVTMGCGEECPLVPEVDREDWPLSDPQGLPLPDVRIIRDEIRDRVQLLIRRRGWAAATSHA